MALRDCFIISLKRLSNSLLTIPSLSKVYGYPVPWSDNFAGLAYMQILRWVPTPISCKNGQKAKKKEILTSVCSVQQHLNTGQKNTIVKLNIENMTVLLPMLNTRTAQLARSFMIHFLFKGNWIEVTRNGSIIQEQPGIGPSAKTSTPKNVLYNSTKQCNITGGC